MQFICNTFAVGDIDLCHGSRHAKATILDQWKASIAQETTDISTVAWSVVLNVTFFTSV